MRQTLLDAELVAERDRRLAALEPRPPWWRPFARRAWRLQREQILSMDCSMFAAMMRRMYPAGGVEELTVRKHPGLSQLVKHEVEQIAKHSPRTGRLVDAGNALYDVTLMPGSKYPKAGDDE